MIFNVHQLVSGYDESKFGVNAEETRERMFCQ